MARSGQIGVAAGTAYGAGRGEQRVTWAQLGGENVDEHAARVGDVA